MTLSDSVTPRGEKLRNAVRWLGTQGPISATHIAEACRRFDLSPAEEAYLRSWLADSPNSRSEPPDVD